MASILKSLVHSSGQTPTTGNSRGGAVGGKDTRIATKQHQSHILNPRHIYQRYIKDISSGSTIMSRSSSGSLTSINKEVPNQTNRSEHKRSNQQQTTTKIPDANKFIRIKVFDPKRLTIVRQNYPIGNLKYVEQLVQELAIAQGIGPLYKSLFGFRIFRKQIWLAPNQLLCELLDEIPDIVIEFRMRFMPSKIEETKVDLGTFNYIFAQIRHEFINYNEKEPSKKTYNNILGLTVTDLLRHAIENDIAIDSNTQNHIDINKHLPPAITPTMRQFAGSFKEKLIESLQLCHRSGNTDILFIKQQFISYFLENFCPNYGSELYFAEFFNHQRNRMVEVEAELKYCAQACEVTILVNSSLSPSLINLFSIYDVCYATIKFSGKIVEIARTSGADSRFKFLDELTLKSFVSGIDGYYRLMKKWYFNLCKQLESPSLVYLRSIHSHGPILFESSVEKLQNDGRSGSYVIRQSRTDHGKYLIDVLIKDQSDDFKTIPVEYIDGYFVCPEKVTNIEIMGKYECLTTLISEIQINIGQIDTQAPLQLKRCLLPSEYDDIEELLLSLHTEKATSVFPNSIGESMQLPQLIPKSMILPVEDGKITKTPSASIQNATFNKLPVTVKKFQPNKMRDDKSFAPLSLDKILPKLADWIYLRDDTLVKTIGLTIPEPICLVQEYLDGGPLDAFLQYRKNKKELQLLHLLDAIVYLGRALLYLQEKQIIHGKIRCQNILVACNWTPNKTLRIKLSDPLADSDINEDSAFYAPESINPPEHYSSGIDVWAFGTTIWQIFNYGSGPTRGLNANSLSRPKDCMDDIWRIMEECWHIDPNKRIEPQRIIRDVNYAIYDYCSSIPPNFEGKIEDSYSYISGVTTITSLSDIDDQKESSMVGVTQSKSFMSLYSFGRSNSRDSDIDSSRNGSDVHLLDKATHVKSSGHKKLADLSAANRADSSSHSRNWTKKILDISKNMSWVASSSSTGNASSEVSTVSTRELDDLFDDNDNSSTVSDSSIDSASSRLIYSLSDRPWLIDSDQIKLGKLLGQGSCGKVLKAELSQWGENTVVAVKCINQGLASDTSRHDLKREFDILKTLKHENIVNILGFVEEPLMLVMEFIPYGSLITYLKVCRDPLTSLPLMQFATDIVKGMEYLEQKGIVHRDLAARNILVEPDQHVKISDFGLAQFMDPYRQYYEMKTTDRKLPLKWYAPETLDTWIFTSKTDVWSYGVVLWEMYSGGDNPIYPNSNENLLDQLKAGIRLKRPLGCPNFINDLMSKCWQFEAANRSTFFELKQALMSFTR